MGIYKQGLDRNQQLIFPPSLDELVDENNIARAIEEYVEILNISELNIKTKKSLIADGQPAFHPKLLLKIYIYGYSNKIRSSRKLENEIKSYMTLLEATDKEDKSNSINISKEDIQNLKAKKEQYQK